MKYQIKLLFMEYLFVVISQKQVTSVCFSPDGKTISSGADDNSIRLWNAETGVQLRQLDGHSSDVKFN